VVGDRWEYVDEGKVTGRRRGWSHRGQHGEEIKPPLLQKKGWVGAGMQKKTFTHGSGGKKTKFLAKKGQNGGRQNDGGEVSLKNRIRERLRKTEGPTPKGGGETLSLDVKGGRPRTGVGGKRRTQTLDNGKMNIRIFSLKGGMSSRKMVARKN